MPPTPLSSGRAAGQARSGGLISDDRAAPSYDFLRPPKLAREHMRTLQTMAETFAHRLAVLLTSRLRVVSRVEVAQIEQVSVGEHLARITEPVVFSPMSLDPTPGTAMLELSLAACMRSIDRMLGGIGGSTQPQRPLTDIETPLLRDLIEDLIVELREVFAEVERLELKLGQLEYDPQLAPFGGLTEALVVASYNVTVGKSVSVLSVCTPLQSLLPALQRHFEQVAVGAGERAARQAAKELLTARLQEVPVDVKVVFAPVRLRSDQLLDLRPGDIVPLDHPVDMPLDISTATEVFGRAVATKRGQRLACQVVTTEKDSDD